MIKNAKELSETLMKSGLKVISGGTDTHLMLIDLKKMNMTGKDAAVHEFPEDQIGVDVVL